VNKGVESEELERKRHGQRQALYRRIGYTGPNGEYPQFENGHFIHIDENLSVQAARNTLKQRLLMIGIDLGDHPETETHEETQPMQVETSMVHHQDLIGQMDNLFSNSLDD
jgi:hypothetical protein